MNLFLDSSAFAKRFIQEHGSQQVEDLCAKADELYLSIICLPEIVSAMNRRLRERNLTAHQYGIIKQRLSEDAGGAVIVNLVPEVIQSSIRILETSRVRTLDALHVACAVTCRCDLFVSADHRQIAAAKNAGLRTKLI